MEHKLHDREDGLAHCTVCNGAECSMPTDCPGTKMGIDQADAVCDGDIDFINGKWVLVHQDRGENNGIRQ